MMLESKKKIKVGHSVQIGEKIFLFQKARKTLSFQTIRQLQSFVKYCG